MIEKNTGITHEKAVVACLLANTEAITNVIGFLKADMFSSRELGFIYKAIVHLFEQGKRTNYNLIDRTMQEMDRELFLQMNGLAYDPELFTMARDSSQVTEYALLIKDSYIRFRLTEHLNAVKLSLTDVGTPITTILGTLHSGVDKICNDTDTGNEARPLAEIVESNLKDFRKNRALGLDSRAIPSGFTEFDKLTGGGFFPGEIYTLAARPSEGKSMVTLHILQEIAQKGYHVRLVNHEMGDYDTANRSIAMLTDINPDFLRRGVLTEGQEMEVERLLQEELTNLKLDIRYMGNARIESIVTETMLACKRGKCDMLAVDYLQLISAPVEKGGTADEAIGRNINALKDLAVRCNIPVIVVSQMNREIEHRAGKAKIPILSDLRNSGVIEQTSDVVMFVYRPDRLGITKDQDTGENLVGIAKLLLLKNRNGGIGHANFRHNKTFTKLWDFISFNKKKSKIQQIYPDQ